MLLSYLTTRVLGTHATLGLSTIAKGLTKMKDKLNRLQGIADELFLSMKILYLKGLKVQSFTGKDVSLFDLLTYNSNTLTQLEVE